MKSPTAQKRLSQKVQPVPWDDSNQYIILWGCSRGIVWDNGFQFCSKLSGAVYKLLGVRKIAGSSHHPHGNSGVECVNHTRAQMLATVVNELKNNWDEQIPHVEFAYNISVSAATGLASNEVHMGGLPRLPLTIFERTGAAGHQSLVRDHFAYCDLATDRQRRAYNIVREHHAVTVSRVKCRNSALSDALQIRLWPLGVGVQYGCHHPPRCKDGHGRQGPQGQALAHLEWPQ